MLPFLKPSKSPTLAAPYPSGSRSGSESTRAGRSSTISGGTEDGAGNEIRPAGTRQMRVLIIGAGIGGLTLAIALAHQGIRSTILEKAPQLCTASFALFFFFFSCLFVPCCLFVLPNPMSRASVHVPRVLEAARAAREPFAWPTTSTIF